MERCEAVQNDVSGSEEEPQVVQTMNEGHVKNALIWRAIQGVLVRSSEHQREMTFSLKRIKQNEMN